MEGSVIFSSPICSPQYTSGHGGTPRRWHGGTPRRCSLPGRIMPHAWPTTVCAAASDRVPARPASGVPARSSCGLCTCLLLSDRSCWPASRRLRWPVRPPPPCRTTPQQPPLLAYSSSARNYLVERPVNRAAAALARPAPRRRSLAPACAPPLPSSACAPPLPSLACTPQLPLDPRAADLATSRRSPRGARLAARARE
jgi:hypothetical protein